jgi:predicted alpha/beta hydrolase family esterase
MPAHSSSPDSTSTPPVPRVLTLPGLWSSGPDHWQSHWERRDASLMRVEQDDWESPTLSDWVARFSAVLHRTTGPVVLAAHSAGCILAVHWAHQAPTTERAKVIGALLVAPADAEAASFPRGPIGFAPMSTCRVPFPTVVVASRNDPYVTFDRAATLATAWGARLHDAGMIGHINTASGHGPWPDGWMLLEQLRARSVT